MSVVRQGTHPGRRRVAPPPLASEILSKLNRPRSAAAQRKVGAPPLASEILAQLGRRRSQPDGRPSWNGPPRGASSVPPSALGTVQRKHVAPPLACEILSRLNAPRAAAGSKRLPGAPPAAAAALQRSESTSKKHKTDSDAQPGGDNPFQMFSPDLLTRVFKFLPPGELNRVRSVSRQFRQAANNALRRTIIRLGRAAIEAAKTACPFGAGNVVADIEASAGEAYDRAAYVSYGNEARAARRALRGDNRKTSAARKSYFAKLAGGGRCEEFGNLIFDYFIRHTHGLSVNLVYSERYKHQYVVIGNFNEPDRCYAVDAWVSPGIVCRLREYPYYSARDTVNGTAISDGGASTQEMFREAGLPRSPQMLPRGSVPYAYAKDAASDELGRLY